MEVPQLPTQLIPRAPQEAQGPGKGDPLQHQGIWQGPRTGEATTTYKWNMPEGTGWVSSCLEASVALLSSDPKHP